MRSVIVAAALSVVTFAVPTALAWDEIIPPHEGPSGPDCSGFTLRPLDSHEDSPKLPNVGDIITDICVSAGRITSQCGVLRVEPVDPALASVA